MKKIIPSKSSVEEKIQLLSELAQMHEEDITDLAAAINLLDEKLYHFVGSLVPVKPAKKVKKKKS